MRRLVLGLLALLALDGGAQAQSCSGTPNANQICAGPSSGGSGFPSFRAQVNADLPTSPSNSVKGSIAGGAPTDLTATQLTTLCNVFTSSLPGCVSASGGGVTTFLRADGTWTNQLGANGTATGFLQLFGSGASAGSVTLQAFTSSPGLSISGQTNAPQFNATGANGFVTAASSGGGFIDINSFYAFSGSYNFNLPTTAGSAGTVLTSQGGGTTPMTWTNPVTSGNLDSAFGSTRGSILERGVSGWQIVLPSSTAGLPWVSNGTGADPAYQALTGVSLSVPFTQSLAVSGNLATVAGFGFNPISVGLLSSSDNASCTCPTPGQNIPTLLSVQQNFGGSNINNGRNGFTSFINLTTATSASNPYRFYVAGNFYAQAQTADNGTGGSPAGEIEAITGSTQLTNGATNYFAQVTAEFDISTNTGASVKNKAALLLAEWPSDAVHGSSVDTWIWTYGFTGGVGMNTWAQIDAQGGLFALTTTGTVIKLIGSNTIATGFDFGNLTISGSVLQWANATYNLTGGGNAALNFVSASGGINFGASNTFFIGGGHSTGASTPGALTNNKPGANNSVISWLQVTLGGVTTGWIPIWGN